MKEYSYDDIIYVGSSKPLICRDGNIKYAQSMELKFSTYDELSSLSYHKCIIIDISAGWTTDSDMDIIEMFINDRVVLGYNDVFVRLVDQYNHQLTSPAYSRLLALLHKYPLVKVIGTYNADYYGLDVKFYVPYPYLNTEEKSMSNRKVINKCILTGANIPDIYPVRAKLTEIARTSKYIDVLSHPGYSGNHWDDGVLGNDYLKKLSEYKCMLCTTCNEKYELLKYIECAEVNAVPIGELPAKDGDTNIFDDLVVIPDTALVDSESFDKWYESLSDTGLFTRRDLYRKKVKHFRDRHTMSSRLLYGINNSL